MVVWWRSGGGPVVVWSCFFYTSDAVDDLLCVDLGVGGILLKIPPIVALCLSVITI